MSKNQNSVTFLEGLGYTAALMIGAAGLTEDQALRFFNVAGLVFGLIAIVRLLAMNIKAGRPAPGLQPFAPQIESEPNNRQEESSASPGDSFESAAVERG